MDIPSLQRARIEGMPHARPLSQINYQRLYATSLTPTQRRAEEPARTMQFSPLGFPITGLYRSACAKLLNAPNWSYLMRRGIDARISLRGNPPIFSTRQK